MHRRDHPQSSVVVVVHVLISDGSYSADDDSL
jgi:hypothetical protein